MKITTLLKEMDFCLWFEKYENHKARQLIASKLGFRIPQGEFDHLTRKHCRWFQKMPRRNPLDRNELTNAEWEQLRKEVWLCKDDLVNKSIEEAVAIVSRRFPCNQALLSGLPASLRIWL